MARFYLTTPLYYVNDVPHIGHAYTTVAADVLARWRRLIGDEVFFLTGTDEHGQKVEQAAAKRRVLPQQHVDEYVVHFQSLWKRLNISNDDFIRTTEPRHKAIVASVLEKLWKGDAIYKATYQGWYCLPDERYWTEKDLIHGNCPDCGRPVEPMSESNYFFKMSQYQQRLIEHIREYPDFIQPESRKNEVLGFLAKPLEDLCISRPKARLSWGIPLPFDPDYVTYVWVDALVNYITCAGYGTDDFDQRWPADVHLVGKDILTTHAVYWSTLLMALDLPLPKALFAHGWWTVDGEKMSKSRSNVVDPNAIVDAFGVDAFRYFLMREVPFGQDGNFSHEAMLGRYNSDLANDLGNLVSRTGSLIEQLADGVVPKPLWTDKIDGRLSPFLSNLKDDVSTAMNGFEFHTALKTIWGLVDKTNRYIEEMSPWQMAKTPSKKEGLRRVLYTIVTAVRWIAYHLWPFMPTMSETILERTGGFPTPLRIPEWFWDEEIAGKPVTKGPALFPRKEKVQPVEKKAAADLPPVCAPTASPLPEIKPIISYDDFSKIDLRVGIILEAVRVPKSKKLLQLSVDIGSEKRQIVAGIGATHPPEALIGRKIVVIVNLASAKIMGVESQGMLLAAGAESVLGLTTFLEDDIPPGTRIK